MIGYLCLEGEQGLWSASTRTMIKCSAVKWEGNIPCHWQGHLAESYLSTLSPSLPPVPPFWESQRYCRHLWFQIERKKKPGESCGIRKKLARRRFICRNLDSAKIWSDFKMTEESLKMHKHLQSFSQWTSSTFLSIRQQALENQKYQYSEKKREFQES